MGLFGWMVVRFVRVIRVPACARVSRVPCVSRLPPVSFYRYMSGLAAVLAAVESVAVFVRVCVFGFGWMVVRFVRVIRLPACARVSRER